MKNNEKINWAKVKSIIYEHIDCKAIFLLTLGFFHPNKRFKNPFRLDKKADCTFFQDKNNNNIWLFHDFAFGQTYDIFLAYELSQGLGFIEIIKILAESANCTDKLKELGLFLDSEPLLKESDISGLELLKRLREQKKKEKKEMDGIKTAEYLKKKEELLALQASESWTKEKPVYKYIAYPFGEFQPHHEAVFAKRGLVYTEIKGNVVALRQVYTEKTDGSRHIVFTDTPENPLFLYVRDTFEEMIVDEKTFNDNLEDIAQQIYRPYSENKKYKFRNIGSPEILIKNWKDELAYNLAPITISGKTRYYPWKGVIVTKGFKEMLLLKKLMKDYIITGKCGESTKLDAPFMEHMDAEFGHKDFPIYIWMDNDKEGRKCANNQEAHYLNMGYTSVFKVFINDDNVGHKDIDEMVVFAIEKEPRLWQEYATTVLEHRIFEAIGNV